MLNVAFLSSMHMSYNVVMRAGDCKLVECGRWLSDHECSYISIYIIYLCALRYQICIDVQSPMRVLHTALGLRHSASFALA